MKELIVEALQGSYYTLVELRECSRLDESFIVACIEHGVIEVSGQAPPQWRFSTEARLQLQRAWRLHQDLELQLSALPLVLDLLDEIDRQRSTASELRQRLRQWEDRD